MRYLLDSNVVTDFYDKSAPDHPLVCARLAALNDDDDVFVSIITLYEFEYGLANAPEDKKAAVGQKLSETLTDFEVLPLSMAGAKVFGAMKLELRQRRGLTKEGIKKHNIDLMIAATAVVERCLLVSADALYADLCDVYPRLGVENWLK